MGKAEKQGINGKFLYYAFIAGGNQILHNQAEINGINVFPVNDKDTGTNLASTVRWIIDTIKPHKSYKTLLSFSIIAQVTVIIFGPCLLSVCSLFALCLLSVCSLFAL
ncbi:MAG: hypothetical protein ACLFQA_07515, partial [Bacteroidales bacterium]